MEQKKSTWTFVGMRELIKSSSFKMENEISITKYSSYSGMSFFEPYSTAIQLHGFIQ